VSERSAPPSADLSTHLERRPARADAGQPLTLSGASRAVELLRPDQLAAVGVGLLILERAASHGGTRMPVYVLRDLRERLTEPLSSRDVMTLEVEAYDTMCWLAGLDTAPAASARDAPPPHAELVDYDPEMPVVDLLRRALLEEFDVEIQYYTQSRGELTRRRISPLHLQAETYLHAYCHSRLAERVFRLSRIAEIRPVDGRPLGASGGKSDPSRGQGSLF
jgi:hypothetical protein